jgi:hypothetical protein
VLLAGEIWLVVLVWVWFLGWFVMWTSLEAEALSRRITDVSYMIHYAIRCAELG